MQTEPNEIVNICFQRSKKLHLDTNTVTSNPEECSKTDSYSINVEPTESDKENFFSDLGKLKPTSAALTTVVKQLSESTHASVILKLPPTLAARLYDSKYKDLPQCDLGKVCESAFQKLSITTDEAKYLEESTRLQSQSKLWFDHRVGRITASKFAAISKASLNPPPASLVKEVMGENKNLKGVPALDWGTKNEATAREEYLKGAKEMHVSFKYRSTGLHVSVQYPHLGATPDGLVECECCGPGLIEIKCPFKYRQCKISDIVDKSFCVQPNEEDGKLKLSHNHAYYLQIQGQLILCQKPYCDFIVWTECDLFVERINSDNEAFQGIKPSLDNFFILPKLLRGIESCESHTPSTSNTMKYYCHCRGPEEGRMIACDNSNCEVEWFHFRCVGLTRKPRGFWYCSEACKLKPASK